jgi:putative two-component system response regulator
MKILIADDNHFYRCALKATLAEWGYDVIAAADGEAAWAVLDGPNPPKLAVLDWMMPKADGLEVCRRLRRTPRPEPTYVIVLTSREGKANVVAALESGADDFVTKPFDREELAARLRVGRRIVDLQTCETVIYSFAQAVDGKSPYTRGHSDRVRRVALALADHLKLSAAETEVLRRGASLHDIGKIAVPDAILNKPGPLTADEYGLIKRHPEHGARMVEGIEALREAVPLIRWHHERTDGRGYPDGLTGREIPPLVRVLSVADVYDALRSDRPYRAGLAHDLCLELLRKDAAGGGLDAELVERICTIPALSLAPPADAAPASRVVPTPPQRGVAAPTGS